MLSVTSPVLLIVLWETATFRAALITLQHFRKVDYALLEDHCSFDKSNSQNKKSKLYLRVYSNWNARAFEGKGKKIGNAVMLSI